jgi:adenine-specific DNA-methyltransferase
METMTFLIDQRNVRALLQDSGLSAVQNHIVVGDCVSVLKSLPDNSVDLVHTSPPYNIAKEYKGGRPDVSPLQAYEQFLAAVIDELKRVLKPNGAIFWQTGYTQVQNGVAGDIQPIDMLTDKHFRNTPNPFILWDRIIWRYLGGMAFKRKLTNKHETIMWYVKPDEGTAEPRFDVDTIREKSRELDKRNNFWGRNPGNVWEVDRVAYGSTEQSSHIAVYPEEISEKIIRACSSQGALILDPFSGSGTTPKVARSLGRRWIGIEISQDYASESAVRLGYQQPSEVWSLASSVTKFEILRGRGRTIEVSDIVKHLFWWAKQVDVQKLRRHFEVFVKEALEDTSKTGTLKKKAWIEFDRMIADRVVSDTVIRADRYLLRDYKNRRNLNGVMRYRTALEILESLVGRITDSHEEDLVNLVLKLASEEPSSYEFSESLFGTTLSLLSIDKRLKVSNGSGAEAEASKDGESGSTTDGVNSSFQPKLPF